MTETLCWRCQRAMIISGVGCSWAFRFEPVPGWSAIRNDVSGKKSYRVFSCPLFLPDKTKNEEERKMEPSRTPNKTSMDRFDKDSGKLEIKLSATGVTLPKGDEFEIGKTYALYLEKDGDGILIAKEETGFSVQKSGYKGGGKSLYCKNAMDALAARGAKIPQTAALQKLQSGEFYAKLAVGMAVANGR